MRAKSLEYMEHCGVSTMQQSHWRTIVGIILILLTVHSTPAAAQHTCDDLTEGLIAECSIVPPKGGGQGGKLIFKNNCIFPVRLAVRFRDLLGQWVTRGWYNVLSGKHTTLAGKVSTDLLLSTNRLWYYYAECTGGGTCVWSGQHVREFRGRSLAMMEQRTSGHNLEWSVTCDGWGKR